MLVKNVSNFYRTNESFTRLNKEHGWSLLARMNAALIKNFVRDLHFRWRNKLRRTRSLWIIFTRFYSFLINLLHYVFVQRILLFKVCTCRQMLSAFRQVVTKVFSLFPRLTNRTNTSEKEQLKLFSNPSSRVNFWNTWARYVSPAPARLISQRRSINRRSFTRARIAIVNFVRAALLRRIEEALEERRRIPFLVSERCREIVERERERERENKNDSKREIWNEQTTSGRSGRLTVKELRSQHFHAAKYRRPNSSRATLLYLTCKTCSGF